MRIGIFETEHFEGAYPVIKLFDNGKNHITIFTYSKPYSQFQHLFKQDHDRYTWVVREENESKYRFMYRMYRALRKSKTELLYLNTIADNHLFYAIMVRLLVNVRVIVTIHNINNYFLSKWSFSFRQFIRTSGKKSLVRAVKEYNVVSDTTVHYLRSLIPAHKKVHCVPGAVFEGKNHTALPPATMQLIKLVVPGTVDLRRRNYEAVFELLYHCNQLYLPVSVVLLGGYYGEGGRQILEKCREYALNHSNLLYYDTDVVDQPEFDRVMNEAHFVFIPTRIETVLSDGILEIYGKTTSSGNLFDIIKHAKPFIVPSGMTLPKDLESAALRYQTIAEIIGLLQMAIQSDAYYEQLSKRAFSSSENYTINKVRERNPMLFANTL